MKKDEKDNGKKNTPIRTGSVILVCVILLTTVGYLGYRIARDTILEKFIEIFMDDDTTLSSGVSEESNLQEAAETFEKINGKEVEQEEVEQEEEAANPQTTSKPSTPKDLVRQIPEGDKNRAIAIVSSVASIDDCWALYDLAINGDQDAKQQLKAIYSRFTQSQRDELWYLYEKNKNLL
ncbi:MAG: hypothetical protein PHE51_04385 [Eubacteriales bacterium]|nr:hypothetical protein [Eubacteriales bacterium]